MADFEKDVIGKVFGNGLGSDDEASRKKYIERMSKRLQLVPSSHDGNHNVFGEAYKGTHIQLHLLMTAPDTTPNLR